MFEPFIWMFKVPEFKRHFMKLILTLLAFWAPLSVIYFSFLFFFHDFYVEFGFLLNILYIVLCAMPFLCLTGYFWCLTENIIDRSTDVVSSNIYDGKVKVINIIELPDWCLPKFLWRGIASIFASAILTYFIITVMSLIFTGYAGVIKFWGWNDIQSSIFIFIIILCINLLIPALLWNYAAMDSIVAVLNVPKVISIISSNFTRYIIKIISMVVISLLQAVLMQVIFQNCAPLIINMGIEQQIIFLSFVNYIILAYAVYVYAYVLGTMFPTCEKQ